MSKAKLLIIGIISILAFFIISSCAPVVDKVDVEREGTSSEETGNILEEGVKEPEEFEVVDYENAVIGAEIAGYIPSYLC